MNKEMREIVADRMRVNVARMMAAIAMARWARDAAFYVGGDVPEIWMSGDTMTLDGTPRWRL